MNVRSLHDLLERRQHGLTGAILARSRHAAHHRRSDTPHESRYGLGFWLHASSHVVMLEGCDAGVSFRSAHDPDSMTTHTVISNTTDGAWPIAPLLAEYLSMS
jgi:hypothetical protein